MKHNKKGFTLIELLVVMSIIALLLSILVPALGKARAQAQLLKDGTQVKSIGTGWVNWTGDHDGYYPVPGLEQRLEDTVLGAFQKGVGREDYLQNDHGSLLSLCLMNNLFTPDILMAPTEPNGSVYSMDDYDYDVYDSTSAGWTFWDKDFKNELNAALGSSETCNNSYGIMPITGEHRLNQWKISARHSSSSTLIGTRGPALGVIDMDEPSLSLGFHGIANEWKGVLGFGDAHTEILDTFYPAEATFIDSSSGETMRDNIFAEETVAADARYGDSQGSGSDTILTHISAGSITGNPESSNPPKFGEVSEYRND